MRRRHRIYYTRLAVIALGFIALSLAGGVAGYHYTENLPWLDALLNASMILGGMGPVDTLKTADGKLFASFYALYSCFVALGAASILLMPAMHHVLYRFHSDPDR